MIPADQLRLQVLQDFAEVQAAWQGQQFDRAALRHAVRFAEQRSNWEETRRVTLATSPTHRARRQASLSKYERAKWQATRADPAKRAAHNAKRMAAYYRKKAKSCPTV